AAPGPVGGQLFDYGTDCTGEDIDNGVCPMVDGVGHGTHVTGTAAGDGSATGRGQPAWRFPGGAPDADLVVVKGGDAAYTADRLVDGVAYIFARAEALGRPAVVNVSLSSQAGPHDGTTLLEQALDALSGPGRIVVTGSGNAGDHRNTEPVVPNGPYHVQGSAGQGRHAVRIRGYRPRPGAVNDGLILELWYDGSDSLAVTVRTPRGDAVTVATGDSATLSTDGGTATLMNAVDGPSPLNGDHAALIGIVDELEALPPDSGRWEIQVDPVALNAGGTYHLWLAGVILDSDVPPGLEGGVSNRYLVGVPATADRVLSAGAHVTRHEWLGVDGTPNTFFFREPMGSIAYFSSAGPRRDGVLKPDLTAPGKVVISSLSRNATLWEDYPELVESDSVHVGLLGTSMAAPQLTAAVAVLLLLVPELTPVEARDLLRAGGRRDAATGGGLPNAVWGAGKLDAAASAERLRPEGLAGSGEAVTLSSNPIRGDALVISYAEPPRSMAVYTVIAERVRSFSGPEIGPLTTVWPLDTDAGGAVANGVYVLVVELDGDRVVRKILVARP
ncbi:MAG: S8 family serine peptidase, partial [Gemmatimonadota bacterium]